VTGLEHAQAKNSHNNKEEKAILRPFREKGLPLRWHQRTKGLGDRLISLAVNRGLGETGQKDHIRTDKNRRGVPGSLKSELAEDTVNEEPASVKKTLVGIQVGKSETLRESNMGRRAGRTSKTELMGNQK